jgi:hypothetical protein
VEVLFVTLLYDVNSIRHLHCVDLDDVADVSKVHAASIFRVKVFKVDEFLCTYRNSSILHASITKMEPECVSETSAVLLTSI